MTLTQIIVCILILRGVRGRGSGICV